MRRFVLPILVAAALVSGGRPAVALAKGADDGISAREKAQAKKAYQHALELYKAGDYKNAAIELRKAYDYAPLPPILYNLGVTYMKLGNKPAARAALSEYLNAMPNASNKAEVKQLLSQLGKDDAGAVETAPAEATEAAPAPAEKPAAPAAPQRPIVLGKDDDTENPLAETPAPAGARVAAHSERTATIETSDASRYKWWKWGAAAGAVACVTIGALMLNQASQQADALQAAQPQNGGYPTTRYDQSVRDLEDGYSINKTWGSVALIGGAALAATSVTLFILDSSKPINQRARVMPAVGAGVAAITVGGSF